MQERRVSLLLEEARKRLPAPFDERHVEAFAEQENHFHDALYVSLEDQFRGSREEIKRRLRYYLPFIKEAGIIKDILDVGCGRGEWLELLREEGLSGLGVDVNHVLVERCHQMGLEVVKEDAIDYLRRLPDNSLQAVTSFHMIEHLPFRVLMKLLDEIVRTLKPGGVLILETPNPENVLVGSCNFYLDPTHRNPLPSQLVHFLLESRGLCRLQTIKLQPWNEAKVAGDTELTARFNDYFYGPMDYAVMGWKV